MKSLGNFFKVVGWFITVTMILGLFGMMFDENETAEDFVHVIIGYVVIGLAPLLLGYWLVKKAKQEEGEIENIGVEAEQSSVEVEILKLSRKKEGVINVVDVAIELGVTSKQAQEILDKLYSDGLFDLQLTEQGNTLYKLRNYSSKKDRKTATSVH